MRTLLACLLLAATSAFGYLPPKDDPRWQEISQHFAGSHYDVLELLRSIALSDLSYRPGAPKMMAASAH